MSEKFITCWNVIFCASSCSSEIASNQFIDFKRLKVAASIIDVWLIIDAPYANKFMPGNVF